MSSIFPRNGDTGISILNSSLSVIIDTSLAAEKYPRIAIKSIYLQYEYLVEKIIGKYRRKNNIIDTKENR